MTTPASDDSLRISDADRERVAALLRDAVGQGRLTLVEVDDRLADVYAARTLGELRPITQDLPGHDVVMRQASRAMAARPSAGVSELPAIVSNGADHGKITTVFSDEKRQGQWTMPKHLKVSTLFGTAKLDFTQASFAAAEVVLDVAAVFGNVRVLVPPSVTVVSEAQSFFGSVKNNGPEVVVPGGPTVRIVGTVLFADVKVTGPNRVRGWLRRNQLGADGD